MKKITALFLSLIFIISFAACSDVTESPENESTTLNSEETTVSEDSAEIYEEDTTIGEGKTALSLKVITEDKTLSFTIMTDKTVLGDALTESGIVEGEEGPYGLYIKKVNGISAVYETDGAYWSLSVNGETAITGADGIEIDPAATYELTKTKS